jgi:hypothetical protein
MTERHRAVIDWGRVIVLLVLMAYGLWRISE